MIEVEKKFTLSTKQHQELIRTAQFLSKRIFHDTYYDDTDYSLGKNDIWLRNREGKWQLKRPFKDQGKRLTDQYEELTNETEIAGILQIKIVTNLLQAIEDSKYHAFCKYQTQRTKYQRNDLILDFDEVTFDDGFLYEVCEIEKMVSSEKEVDSAISDIMQFALEHKLAVAPVRGKILEYIKRRRPEHFAALQDSPLFRELLL